MRKALLAVLAVAAGACSKGPTSPTEVWRPNTGPRATMSWELWVGSPWCVTMCSPPPQFLGGGGGGAFVIETRTSTRHAYRVKVNYPQEPGHRLKTTIWTDLETPEAGYKPKVIEGQSGNRNVGIDVISNFSTRRDPGVYYLRITVEETLPSGAVENLQAEIEVRLRQ